MLFFSIHKADRGWGKDKFEWASETQQVLMEPQSHYHDYTFGILKPQFSNTIKSVNMQSH